MTACQVKIRTDDRLSILVPCGKPDAVMARVTCGRAGHAENLIMCRRCMGAMLYCEQCMDEDRMLVRATLLLMA